MYVWFLVVVFFFFFNDTATTEIYTLSLHDALPISRGAGRRRSPRLARRAPPPPRARPPGATAPADRKSTRLNSSHTVISYAVFCLKKKKKKTATMSRTDLEQSRSDTRPRPSRM